MAAVEENEILGDPYVNCGGNHIEVCYKFCFFTLMAVQVRFDTRNTFRGSVFVKGQLEWPECRSAPIDTTSAFGSRNASIRLNFKVRSLCSSCIRVTLSAGLRSGTTTLGETCFACLCEVHDDVASTEI